MGHPVRMWERGLEICRHDQGRDFAGKTYRATIRVSVTSASQGSQSGNPAGKQAGNQSGGSERQERSSGDNAALSQMRARHCSGSRGSRASRARGGPGPGGPAPGANCVPVRRTAAALLAAFPRDDSAVVGRRAGDRLRHHGIRGAALPRPAGGAGAILVRSRQRRAEGRPCSASRSPICGPRWYMRSTNFHPSSSRSTNSTLCRPCCATGNDDEAKSVSCWTCGSARRETAASNLELARLAANTGEDADAKRYYNGAIYGVWDESARGRVAQPDGCAPGALSLSNGSRGEDRSAVRASGHSRRNSSRPGVACAGGPIDAASGPAAAGARAIRAGAAAGPTITRLSPERAKATSRWATIETQFDTWRAPTREDAQRKRHPGAGNGVSRARNRGGASDAGFGDRSGDAGARSAPSGARCDGAGGAGHSSL